VTQQSSLRQALTHAIVLTSLGMLVIAALFSGAIAFFEAKERQDDLLISISELVSSRQLAQSEQMSDDTDEETLIVRHNTRDHKGKQARLLNTLPLGLNTREIHDNTWRLNIQEHPALGSRFMVAQQTAIRNESAVTGALYGFIPAATLVALMLFIVNWVVRRQFRRLDGLAQRLDHQGEGRAQDIDAVEAPDEIRPFLSAISRLLTRNAEVLRRQRRFIADAAHELRSPIAALVLQLDNLKNANESTDAAQRLERLEQSGTRLQRLVVQLLDLARLQNRDIPALATVDWRDVIRDVVTERLDVAESRQIDLGVSEVVSAQVHDHAQGLSRLLGNALDNALRHTPPGGRIDISLTVSNGVAQLIVDDTGPGIADEELGRVFEPFNRGASAGSEGNATGTGLGLSICREIASLLEGEVSLLNRPEGGLRFLYRQPLTATVAPS